MMAGAGEFHQNEMSTSASSRSATQPAGAGRSASELAGIGGAVRATGWRATATALIIAAPIPAALIILSAFTRTRKAAKTAD
jgi:hypothetical protein